MKEHPILFSAPMVQAILVGNKTQTRRIVKGCIPIGSENSPILFERCPYGQVGDQLWVRENFQPLLAEQKTWDDMPYVNYKTGEGYAINYPATDGIVEFVDADDDVKSTVKPSIFMPRWASRIQLEITSVRVERLQDISETDALAEGVNNSVKRIVKPHSQPIEHIDITAKDCFIDLWESINGAESWQANPWVWVIEFKVIKP